MQLTSPDEHKLQTLISWFDDETSVSIWGGPDMRFPMTLDTLSRDARLSELASRFLVDAAQTTLGFGQFYERLGHCHLGRLVIAPQHRGRRLGEVLIEALAREAQNQLNLPDHSLFVLKNNASALALYRRLGFKSASYSGDDIDHSDTLYMIRRTKSGPGDTQ